MGVAIVGSIITSYVVSSAVTAVGEKIGLPEDLTSILGTVAGAYAGGMTYDSATGAAANAGTGMGGAVPDVALPPTEIGAPASAQPSGAMGGPPGGPTRPAPIGSMGGPPGGPTGGGMLKSAGPVTPNINTQQLTPDIVTPPPPPNQSPSWYEKLMSADKTGDIIAAGIQGYAQTGIEKYKLQYPQKIKDRNAKDWIDKNPRQGT
jgi:hypothetical protein